MNVALQLSPELEAASQAALGRLVSSRFAERLFAQDSTLWGPEAQAEASVRVGWTDPFAHAEHVLVKAIALRQQLISRGISRVVLCGMGGSSLGPEVVAHAAGASLEVLDSVHPREVSKYLTADLRRTVTVFSSKSGTTIETTSHIEAFRHAFVEAGLDPSMHMVFVTDPGSPLAAQADDGYEVFLADPNIGGRFSVLSAFGIVPTVLAGVDFKPLLRDANTIRPQLAANTESNPALHLAAALFSQLPERYVLLLDEFGSVRTGLGDWIEQLVAESTGKQGKGVLPMALPDGAWESSHSTKNSVFAHITTDQEAAAGSPAARPSLRLQAPLGAQLLLWEVATTALGHLLQVNPFDQPDVESAKVAARASMTHMAAAAPAEPLESLSSRHDLIRTIQAALPNGGYLAVQAFLDSTSGQADLVRELREELAEALEVPVSLGWGPRYLHSVGQFHKGGPNKGVFLQLIDESPNELAIPGSPHGFDALLRAQACGDRKALTERGRVVIVRSV